MKHFFSPNSSGDLRSDAHQSQIIGGDADEDHTLIIGGDAVKLLGGIGVARIFDWGEPKPSKIRLSSPKLRVNFGPKSEIRTIFPPKFR